LIKDLENRGINIGPAPREEPWETYPDLKKFLSKEAYVYPKVKVSDILGTGFNARLGEYLEVLRECVSPIQKKKVGILLEAIQFINQMKGDVDKLDRFDKIGVQVDGAYHNWSLDKIYSEGKGIFPAQGPSKSDRNDFNGFIGLCLFLSAASKLTYKLANDLAGQAPFAELPFT
jgi:hypothetical protein